MKEAKVFEMDQARVYHQLDKISAKIDTLSKEMSAIGRLEETVNSQHAILLRLEKTSNQHDERLREVELLLAKKPGFTQLDERVNPTWDKLRIMEIRMSEVEKNAEKSKGRKDVAGSVFKWAMALFAAVFLAMITGKL